MNPAPNHTALDAPAIARYLEEHPDFLDDYPDIATRLTVRRQDGSVASFSAYQVEALREKNAELETRLAELAAIAADNEKLMQRVHRLTVALLRANTLEVATRTIVAKLCEDFRSEQVRLILFGDVPALPRADWLIQLAAGSGVPPEWGDFPAVDEPFSGRLPPERAVRLFGDNAGQIQSAAVMRIGDEGVLAIGSVDANRFQPGMGTMFLRMIAATVTAAFARSRDVA